jgi:phage/plasmid primase-like uncharacterized protein
MSNEALIVDQDAHLGWQWDYLDGGDLMSNALNCGLASAWWSVERLERSDPPASVRQECEVYFGERG